MFLRMVTASLLRRRSRMLIALLSIGIGATILSGLVTIYYDVPRQMGAQFRSYGANMILLPQSGGQMTAEEAQEALDVVPEDQVIGATPYRYVTVNMASRQLSFIAAGTDFDQVQQTSPYFQVEGEWPSGSREVLVGQNVADSIGVKVGSVMEITWTPAQTDTGDDGDGADGAADGGDAAESVTEADGGDAVESATEADGTDTAAAGDIADRIYPGAQLAGSAEGFENGIVYVTALLDEDMKIAEIAVNAQTQTMGVGTLCEEEDFTGQFIGCTLPLTLGEEIDAVSGATFTSQAVVDALNNAQVIEEGQSAVTASTLNMKVTGILDTGGDEEDYIFMSMSDMGALTGDPDSLDVMELSISATSEELTAWQEEINGAEGAVSARLVKRVTKSETAVLSKLQALVLLVTIVVLALTMICVSTTMMAVVTERRKEIGLRKALGASDGSIRAEFLGEGVFLGALGGLLGCVLGFVFAQVVSVNVFGSSITFQPLLLPVTVIVSVLVSALSCLLPIKHAVQIDPALVLKGE